MAEQQVPKLALDKDYKSFLIDIKSRLRKAKMRAALAVNIELVRFYWQLGADIVEKQKAHQWGSKFLIQLSHDMRNAFPGMQGFSRRNLEHMRRFYSYYPKLVFAKQAVSQIPWGHIVRLMQLIETRDIREWYAEQTIRNGWSRSVLEMQIQSGLYERQAKGNAKISNFHQQLPTKQSQLATEILKDPYNFDFLTIEGRAHERVIEKALITHVRDFLLELGKGFAFVGSQVPITIDDEEFFIDLLFYHLELRAFVVVELKATKFKPEHTGQLGFYLAAVDDLMRKEGDNQTIGILLCQSKSKIVAEYALRNIKGPIGISQYDLAKSLPNDIQVKFPTVKEIETKLSEKLLQ
ncbi:MAG: PDDEXK nuclease domain-containing protein [Coxiellaceae bacterium]|nr:PDDEXK nuclease domain-containing protein [Coxiellaceae bacterium]